MELFGLLARAALLKSQRHMRACPRCGRLFDQRQTDCPHCKALDETQLARLLESDKAIRQGNAVLGRWMLAAAAVLGLLMVLVLAA